MRVFEFIADLIHIVIITNANMRRFERLFFIHLNKLDVNNSMVKFFQIHLLTIGHLIEPRMRLFRCIEIDFCLYILPNT